MKELTIDCLCRVCLKNSHLHKNIYEGHSLDEFLVYELVNDVCDLGISADDGLPEFLCGECFTKIIEFKLFKTNAQKGRATFLLLNERVEYPMIKQEEFEISGDESEELVDGTNTEPIFGPILLKNEMLTVYSDCQKQEEVIKSEVFVSVDAVEPPATYIEDSRQEADHGARGSELCEEGALSKESFDDDMEPLMLEPENMDIDSTEVHVSLLDTGAHPQYLQPLEHKRPPCESKLTAEADSCTQNNHTDVESVFEISKNISLSVEIEASSNGKKKKTGRQWIHQGKLRYMAPSLQEKFGIGKERGTEEIGTGEGGEGLRATAPEKKLEGKGEGFECYDCGKVLMSKHCLIQHMKVHGFDNSCDCKVCLNVFQTKVNPKCHDLKQTCSKTYICTQCSKSFSRSAHLQIHIRSHTGSKPYKCAECSKCFSQQGSLITHMRIHTGLKSYKCLECSKCFSQSSNLHVHMRTHTASKPYKCAVCSKSFCRSTTLMIHMRIHTGSKPYKCADCNKSFRHSSTLKMHMRTHTGSKPYKCADCSKCFTNISNLYVHMRTHTGSKPYKCAECSKSFSRSGTLKKHMRSHAG